MGLRQSSGEWITLQTNLRTAGPLRLSFPTPYRAAGYHQHQLILSIRDCVLKRVNLPEKGMGAWLEVELLSSLKGFRASTISTNLNSSPGRIPPTDKALPSWVVVIVLKLLAKWKLWQIHPPGFLIQKIAFWENTSINKIHSIDLY